MNTPIKWSVHTAGDPDALAWCSACAADARKDASTKGDPQRNEATEINDTIHIPIRQRFDAALNALLREAYREGLEAGLQTADKIVGWLSRLPDTKRQRETREWAEMVIKQAREAK